VDQHRCGLRNPLRLATPRNDNGRVGRFPLIPALVLAAAAGTGFYLFQEGTDATSTAIPGVLQVEPQPGGPPVVWVSGALENVEGSRLTIREGQGQSVELHRLAAGSSRFLRVSDGRWQELSEEETADVRPGERVCAETLLDGTTFVALRVFVGASGCGPA
jgi:hypothetical protein